MPARHTSLMWVSVSCRILLLCFLLYPHQFLPLRQCAEQLSTAFEHRHASDVLVTAVSPSPRRRGPRFGQSPLGSLCLSVRLLAFCTSSKTSEGEPESLMAASVVPALSLGTRWPPDKPLGLVPVSFISGSGSLGPT